MLSLYSNTIILFTITLPLTTPIPTTNTNRTRTTHPAALSNLPTSILPHELAADTCPTPPTEFLPYAPPPGYTPAPGCSPAGTQPSEGNPPAGVYGGSGSGSSGSTSYAEASGVGTLRIRGLIGRVMLVMLGWWGLSMYDQIPVEVDVW